MGKVVIGDIHGGFKALKQLLESANFPKNTQYIFVGDYVDGWSQSAEVVSYLIEFSEENNCIFLRGNHDELLYKYLKFGESNPMWLSQGGESSIKSYAKLSEEKKEKHLQFFESLENYYIDSENRLFMHAGFTNQYGPQHEYYPNLIYWDRTLWEMVCAMDSTISEDDDKYPKRLKLFKEIYIGHTPVTRVGFDKPSNFANVWNVDTGAAFKGKISMLDVDSKEIWQSEAVYLLYPDEKGRN
ncbi:metallophosphoesterase family protein [Aequorivita sp. CIP111184]|uniref:metallophosphoesterase family protein n=1 Tax=Aequorivita sp. CIP111184 TaxID=2211356 RepID=UPI000DBC0F68|nr:metallophosphoesterase family protein [Aequorivita sp. CIP111184]SRX52530.1 Bis(5'-nucleosyl)-tetraphosphatase PrpE [asymmetrical] [Aequorivita sp. CIP111184]